MARGARREPRMDRAARGEPEWIEPKTQESYIKRSYLNQRFHLSKPKPGPRKEASDLRPLPGVRAKPKN
jgi:hypothetical protein